MTLDPATASPSAPNYRMLEEADSSLVPSDDAQVAHQQVEAATLGNPAHRQQVLDLIAAHTDIADRTCRPGHLTGSALVVDPTRNATLLLFHTKLQKWLQPGGHADGDTNLAHVALREATEETGIEGLRVVVPPIDVDVHEVDPPAEDAHLHLDVRFLVIAPGGAEPVGNHESQELRWIKAEDLEHYEPDDGLRRLVQQGIKVTAELQEI